MGRISIAPKDQTKGGGVPDDIDVEVTDAKTTTFTYPGTQVTSPGLLVTFTDDKENTYEQFYRAGDPDKIQPDEDGEGFEPVDDDKEIGGFNEKSKFGIFMRELKAAGFPERIMRDAEGSVKCIIGVKGHLKNIDPPKYGGDITSGSIPVFTKVTELPGEGKKKKKVVKKRPAEDEDEEEDEEPAPVKKKKKPAPEPQEDEDDDAEEEPAPKKKKKPAVEEEEADEDEDADEDEIETAAVKHVRAIVKKAGDTITKAKLGQLLNSRLKADEDVDEDDRIAIVKIALKESFLTADDRPWESDGKTIGPTS